MITEGLQRRGDLHLGRLSGCACLLGPLEGAVGDLSSSHAVLIPLGADLGRAALTEVVCAFGG
eukprot:1157490-Pelagomonas_calceolata.AAC.7